MSPLFNVVSCKLTHLAVLLPRGPFYFFWPMANGCRHIEDLASNVLYHALPYRVLPFDAVNAVPMQGLRPPRIQEVDLRETLHRYAPGRRKPVGDAVRLTEEPFDQASALAAATLPGEPFDLATSLAVITLPNRPLLQASLLAAITVAKMYSKMMRCYNHRT